jgi:hypothetical protein
LNKSHERYKARHDRLRTEKSFKVGEIFWLQLNNEILYGPSKNIKDIWYGPFDVLEKVGDNSYRNNLPPYIFIYSIVNVDNLKHYDPSIIDEEIEEKVLPTIKEI